MTRYYNTLNTTKTGALRRALMLVICLIASLINTNLWAQTPTIGGNVYGGGNQGDVASSSTVELYGGTVEGNVYGGACEANVSGRTFVKIDAKGALIVKGVYGGNDVSGTIGTSSELPFTPVTGNNIDNTWNSFIHVAANLTQPVIIGSLYGGGNGAYTYADESKKPILSKTYIELLGGIYGQVYAGGNNATVSGNTVLYMNNSANLSVTTSKSDFLSWFDNTDYRTGDNGNITFNHHVKRMFGGNNLAEMSIRPTWNLIAGSINNLYSGGNKGAMTAKDGISLTLASANLTVNNVYGGCRMADVHPSSMTDQNGYSTHVRIDAGNITNVYGGNDISGKVHYGTYLEIFSNISGDVYGGGNGSYAYTDKETASDYYYAPSTSSIEALFNFRPHIEKTFIHIAGTQEKPVSIGNSVYCGGNSATLYKANGNAAAALNIGSNVTIGNVFLGSNGENMVTGDMLAKYADNNYNTIALTDATQLGRYMDAVAVGIVPTIRWEDGLNNTTIGSFFCGGNVGSMTYAGVAKTGDNAFFEFPTGLIITDKIVAGCNNANVAAVNERNAAYVGGLTGAADNGNKVNLTVNSTLQPKLVDESYTKANIYGGCYNSGKINGNVVINVNSDIVASEVTQDLETTWGGDINASYLSIYGGGYGEETTIEGNTTINLTGNARILKVFGGGEMGCVTGNTEVNLAKELTGTLNAFKVYAGGFEGRVGGNTTLNLLGGRVRSAFAGACNANIGGSTEVIIGTTNNPAGVPYIAEAVYGGNDFGGTIEGSKLHLAKVSDDNTKNVRTQTYVQYLSGKIGLALYGGSYGSYDYSNTTLYPTSSYTKPTILTSVTKQEGDDIVTNTFVDIASTSTSAEDIIGSDNTDPENEILTMIAGGGRGYKGLPDYVEVEQTYLLLHGSNYANRNEKLMAHRVYGGGNLSKVNSTRIDAYSGSFGQIFGGTHGVYTTETTDLAASYDCGNTEINYYGTMGKADMNLFGTGANSGATGTATINLIAGNVGNVYGGSLAEGYTAETKVNVLSGSTIKAAGIFGGALGESEDRPCDVGVSNVTFASNSAKVENGIYGGNHNYRATKETNITISTSVKNQYGNLLSIYGAGYGAGTVAGFTNVTLEAGAQVAKVYGGGREGKVYNHYKYCTIDGYPSDRQESWTTTGDDTYNTQVSIKGTAESIARVTGNVYGAGYGENAHTSGKTKVQLLGGIVESDIYGGGEKGTMPVMTDATKGFIANTAQTIASLCVIDGGQVRNVFGGGYQGNIEGNSGVNIGSNPETPSFYAGVPTILRSAYGGGEMAKVSGTSTVNMYNGYIGYRYNANSTAANEEDKYIPELQLNAEDKDSLLRENGNLYGAGFGEGAVVMNTKVNLFDGTVRNGVYGGGEIAAVGDGLRNADGTYAVNAGGQTNVYMYGGLVVGDVFGGGRGFSYDLTGNQVIGKTLYSDGYVFGKTNVEIYRGTIGTDASVAEGHGNVFGGGNIGYVYSAGRKFTGPTTGLLINGHYYQKEDDPNTAAYTTTERTEDCRVLISAGSFAKKDITINDTLRPKGTFIPNRVLNTLTTNSTAWTDLDTEGVTIRNAVFAGGNVSAGSDKIYANAVTVFGNATASVVDVFSRDLITLGGEHIGGLYGDGNLTFVDGYRELNITNYGTDYYHLNPDNTKKVISQSTYDALSAREKAYYIAEKGENDVIQYVISRTSGRTMNTIQRADFCGVFGSRFLLHGAQDRVPDVADYTNYTINRVGEVSLNTKTVGGITHGNYFGIYNVVHLLGALTSDVDFTSKRKASLYTETSGESATEPTTSETYIPKESYFDFKNYNFGRGFRNKANCHNMVALASGVYLELVEEEIENKQTGEVTKTYGPITGVIELDLINVKTGEGGGYIYAKNEHRTPNPVDAATKKQLTLSKANTGAITQKAFTYTGENSVSNMQTSGNFVHDEYRIVDDCFPNGGDAKSPAHFWYVIGNYYVYDQTISAYTGSADIYEQSTNIPFTITNGSNGKVQITSIKPNKYFVGGSGVTTYKFGGKVYNPNDLISYWDWTQLPSTAQAYFVDMTYVAQQAVGNYKKGDVISEDKYEALQSNDYKNAFRISNEMSRDNGYLLTYGMTNPLEWDTYFTKATPTGKDDKLLGSALEKKTPQEQKAYLQAPTILCTESGIYGQRTYNSEDLVSQAVIVEHDLIANSKDETIKAAYQTHIANKPQANFQAAYVAISNIQVGNTSYNVGSYISKTVFDALTAEQKTAFESAYLCIRTIEVAEKDFVLNGELISQTRYNTLNTLTSDENDTYMYEVEIEEHFSPAYVCVRKDVEDNDTYYYGGTYFKQGTNYSALDICALSQSDRQAKNSQGSPVFVFNKDALDLFYTNFSDNIVDYGSPYYEENQYLYVDFEATYTGTETSLKNTDGSTLSIANGAVLNRETYMQLLNEQAHYVKVTLLEGTNYIVKTQFKHRETIYLVGTAVDQETYDDLGTNQEYLVGYDNSTNPTEYVYLCREDYTPSSSSKQISIGTIIDKTDYNKLPNEQKDFSIVGRASTETSTLYVPREADIENLSKDRIITVQLEYVYNDNGEEKLENHIVNIHVQFKSGQPTIGNVPTPATVLPNTTIGLSVPNVTPGAYEIIGGGWELYKNEADARAHKNGEAYKNNATPMYWYQNGYYVAYYAKTYLGKVYSNPVKFTIANYHRLSELMNHKVDDKNEYMFIDHEHAIRDRAPKIYLDAAGSENATKNDLDYLVDLYNATITEYSETVTNSETQVTTTITTRELDEQVEGCNHLEFILRSDIAPKAAWTSIGSETIPFAGNLHGNGYTISGLGNQSLFCKLSGKVYNLGVKNGNIATSMTDGGYIENIWVSATTPTDLSGDSVVNYHVFTNEKAASFEKGEVTHTLNSFYAGRNAYNASGYVEKYFADGDFIYANGAIPLIPDERLKNGVYKPLADDYIFFGQKLIYADGHESLPSRIIKQGNSIDRTTNGNRVYGAPAYFMNNTPSQVYFNTDAKFVDSYNSKPIHHNLTAIDFTGYDNGASKLDIEELTGFALGAGLTKNLLVYATENANANSPYTIVSGYLNATEPSLEISSDGYQTIAINNTEVRGHLVTNQNGSYVALTDHFLVDKENFNVPIEYSLASDKHMWYQRTPDRFAKGDNAGWDVICLPFTAKLVTTHQKGEITHFYGESDTIHEYWLRQLKEVTTTGEAGQSTTTASFTRPAVVNESTYTATSTYLYDTYYKNQNDANGDQYQQNYYKDSRSYEGYAYLQANTPYIIAYPGKTYREFDMSGTFSSSDNLTAQVVTMVSANGATIPLTSEMETDEIKDYCLVGTFLAETIDNGYLINAEGNAFENAQSLTVPFRGYLVKTLSQSSAPKRIIIGGETEEVEEEPKEDIIERGLTIYTQKKAICIESTLEHEAAVVIYSTNGQVVARVKVQPMSKEVVTVPSSGIYIVNKRKVMVM